MASLVTAARPGVFSRANASLAARAPGACALGKKMRDSVVFATADNSAAKRSRHPFETPTLLSLCATGGACGHSALNLLAPEEYHTLQGPCAMWQYAEPQLMRS